MKRIGAALCAFILAFALVGAPAPVRAYEADSVFLLPNSGDLSQLTTYEGLTSYFGRLAGNGTTYPVYIAVNTSSVYLVFYDAGGYQNPLLLSESSFSYTGWNPRISNPYGRMERNPDPSATASSPSSTYGGFYYVSAMGNSSNRTSSYAYASVADAVQAVRDYIDNPPSDPSYSGTSTFTLPIGNVAYIKVSDPDSLLTFTTSFGYESRLFGDGWPLVTQTYNKGVQLPTQGTTFPLPNAVTMPWYKTGKLNLLGQSKDARCSITAGSDYVAIYNPIYNSPSDAVGNLSRSGYNQSIVISASGVLDYKVFPLSERVESTGVASNSDSDFGDYWSATIDPDTGDVTYTNQNGDVSSPITGGTSYLPVAQTTSSILERITDLLNSLVERVNGMFSAGHVAITGLVSAMENFAGTIMALYAWLPADVLSVLNSSIILCLIIGVLKVFL